jgi:DNA-binding CsgD family transcriptional regulator
MSDRVGQESSEIAACGDHLAAVLETAGFGVIFARADGRIFCANRSARTLMRLGAASQMCVDGLASNDGCRVALRPFLAQQREAGQHRSPETILALKRSEDDPPIFAHLVALAESSDAECSGGPAVALLVIDVERYIVPALAAFATRHGLTRAEARVLGAIAGGQGLIEAAKQLGVGATTARTHLSRIFSKTGTSRQTELIRLFLGGRRAMRSAG